MEKTPRIFRAHDLRTIAVEAGCDPRSVARHVRGEQVLPLVSERIVRALEKLGYAAPSSEAPAEEDHGPPHAA